MLSRCVQQLVVVLAVFNGAVSFDKYPLAINPLVSGKDREKTILILRIHRGLKQEVEESRFRHCCSKHLFRGAGSHV